MHDISSLGKANCEAMARVIDSMRPRSASSASISGSKIVAVPDKLSFREYLTAITVWLPAVSKVVFHKKQSRPGLENKRQILEDIGQISLHWDLVGLLLEKLRYIAAKTETDPESYPSAMMFFTSVASRKW